MAYGGILKKVVRIAVPAIVSMIPGMQPLGVALAAAAATGATGGSFKEAMFSAATSYVGASISRSINASVAAGAPPPPGMPDTASLMDMGAYTANRAIEGGISNFAPVTSNLGLGGIIKGGQTFLRSAGNVLDKLGGELLISSSGVPSSALGIIGGAATTMTLDQALLANTPEADDLIAQQGYTPQQIEALKQEARNRLAQEQFTRVTEAVPNVTEGLSDEEYNKIIAAGIEKRNVGLGPTTTRAAFEAAFGEPPEALAQGFLTQERDVRREAFGQQVAGAFPSFEDQPLFSPEAFATASQNIIEGRIGPAREEIGRAAARGNLSTLGEQGANIELERQRGIAQGAIDPAIESARTRARQSVTDLQRQAELGASRFELGDPDFDVTPFATQREALVSDRGDTLQRDIESFLGPQDIFDPGRAVQAGGRAQGLISGGRGPLLDVFAQRAANVPEERERRGLGVSGSGRF
jgi:hypothetical protein